jgi:flagellar basal-body rod modification protein FlgD
MSAIFDPAALGLRAASASSSVPRDTMTQDDFLTLLVTQLKNQDPMNPLDNESFVAQLAQFSTVSGITSTNDKLDALSQLTASNVRTGALQWIGRRVEAAEGVAGTVASVGIADDNSLTLTLDTGAMLAAGAVRRMS